MPLTPEEEARYQELSAKYNPPTLTDRFLGGAANQLTAIPQSILGGARGVLNMISREPLDKVIIPPVSVIPKAQTWGETITDAAPHILGGLATLVPPQVAGLRALEGIGMTGKLAQVGAAGIGGMFTGADLSEHQAAMQAGGNAAGRMTDFASRAVRLPLVAASAALTGMDAYAEGASPAAAAGMAIAQGGLNMVFPQERLPFPLKAVPGAAGPIRPMPRTPWGQAAEGPYFRPPTPTAPIVEAQVQPGPRTPWGPQTPAPYFKPPGALAAVAPTELPPQTRGPFRTPWGPQNDNTGGPMYRPPGAVEPSPQQVVDATLQVPPAKPDIQEIVPAIRIGGNIHRGKPGDTHQHILDRHINDNLDDADAFLNFDTVHNPNFFLHGENEISRAQLKEWYGVKDSQGLFRLQKAARDAAAPPPPTTPPPPPERGPFRTPWGPQEQPPRYRPPDPSAPIPKPDPISEPEVVATLQKPLEVKLETKTSRDEGSGVDVFATNNEGKVVGRLYAKTRVGKELRISNAQVDEESRGMGVATQMYEQLIKEAKSRNLILASDNSVTKEAQKIWESLERKGYTIERNPTAKVLTDNYYGRPTERLASENAGPVFRLIEPKEKLKPSDLTRGQRQAIAMAIGKATKGGKEITDAERQAIIDRIAKKGSVATLQTPKDTGFADDVNEAARNAPEGLGEKKFIHDVHAQWEKETGKTMPLAEFKQRLVAELRAGNVSLTRADFVPEDLIPGITQRVRASHIEEGHESWNYVTPRERKTLSLGGGPPPRQLTQEEHSAIVQKVLNPKTGKKSRAKPLDVESYTDGNDLRIVPGKGGGGIEFETMRDIAPGKGKLKFVVPEGTSHAEANKLFKAKKAEALATLQEDAEPSKVPAVPFQDVKSSTISEKEMEWRNLGTPSGLKELRKRRGEHGGALIDVLSRAIAEPLVGALVGGIVGGRMDEDSITKEDKISGIIQGAMAGGLLSVLGMKGVRFLMNSNTLHLEKGFQEVAQQASRGQGSSLSQVARGFEKNFARNKVVERYLSKATGKAHMAAQAWDQSLRYLSRKLKDLPQAQQDLVHDYATAQPFMERMLFARLQTQIGDATILEAALLERQTRVNAQNAILEGLDPSDPMYKTIQDSLGTYQKTAYKIHFDPSFKPTQTQIDDTIKELYFNGPPGFTWDTARATVEQYLHETYLERGMGYMASKYNVNKGAENLGDILRKKNPELLQRPAFRAMMGEVTDPLEVRAATALKLLPAIRSGQFFSEMANARTEIGNRFALSADEWNNTIGNLRARIGAQLSGVGLPSAGPDLPVATLQAKLRELENYVIAPETPSLGLLSGKHVHRSVHDRLPSHEGILAGNSGPILSSLMALNNHVKAAKVGANPMSWMRSFLSVPFFMATARGGTPMNWVAAAREVKNKTPMWREMMEQGILSGGYGTGEAKRDLGIILDPNLTESGLSKMWNKWVSIGAGAMDYADNTVRAASYMNNKARFKQKYPHLSETQLREKTTDFVNEFTMNYSTVPKGIRAVRQLPLANQFITYASEMARITKNLIKEVKTNANDNRWWALSTLATIPAVFEVTQGIFEGNLSKEDRDEWHKVKQLMPAYKRYSYLLPTGKRADGTWNYWNVSPLFIADDIMKMVKGIAAGDWAAVGANNPLVGWDNTPAITVGAAAFGKDVRSGRELPTFNQRFDTIRKEVLPPLIGGYELDNFVKALTPNAEGGFGVTNQRTGQRFTVQDLLASYAIGARKSNVRLDVLMEREMQLADRRVRAVEADYNRVRMTNATPAAMEQAKEITQRKIKTIIDELERKLPER